MKRLRTLVRERPDRTLEYLPLALEAIETRQCYGKPVLVLD